jgi:hypothetical protein
VQQFAVEVVIKVLAVYTSSKSYEPSPTVVVKHVVRADMFCFFSRWSRCVKACEHGSCTFVYGAMPPLLAGHASNCVVHKVFSIDDRKCKYSHMSYMCIDSSLLFTHVVRRKSLLSNCF